MSVDITSMFQSGLVDKIFDEVRFEMQRSITGKLLAAGSGTLKLVSIEEKGLTLEDTQGMFLLLGAGFLIAATALLSEWMGGFSRKCCFKKIGTPLSIAPEEHFVATPKSGDNEIKLIPSTSSRLDFETRTASAESRDTLNGQIISITEDDIIVHNNFNVDKCESRRSSSVDLDREVREIFARDSNNRRFFSEESDADAKRHESVSLGAFGDHVDSK